MELVTEDDAVGLRWQSSALLALQEATEAFLVHLFEDAYATPTLAAFDNVSRAALS